MLPLIVVLLPNHLHTLSASVAAFFIGWWLSGVLWRWTLR